MSNCYTIRNELVADRTILKRVRGRPRFPWAQLQIPFLGADPVMSLTVPEVAGADIRAGVRNNSQPLVEHAALTVMSRDLCVMTREADLA